MTNKHQFIELGEFGYHVLPHMYVVSWLGMTEEHIDCHVYVLCGPDGLLLIDCGTTWGYERILRNMEHWGIDINAVKTVLLTHDHLDHIYGGPLFKQLGVEILGHREIIESVEAQWKEQCGTDENGNAYRMDGTLEDGDKIQRCRFDIEVIHTPGHTRGCLSFLITVDGQRCLFTGDLIMTDGFPGWPNDAGHDRDKIISSIKHLQKIPFDHLCHGHDVILNDRGWLFDFALQKEASGEWDAPDSRYVLYKIAGD